MGVTRTCVPLLLFAALFLAQMPDWKYFRDREGNKYFVDRAGAIRITETSSPAHRPVSARAIDYHINFGETLVSEHRYEEGLAVLKSICALPADNNRIYQAQVRAMEIIGRLRKQNGARFDRMNESASLILINEGNDIVIINDMMRYSFRAPAGIRVIRKKDRAGLDYRYSGILFGAEREAGTYDYLLAVDSESIKARFKDLAEAEEKWRGHTGHQGLTRRTVTRDDDRVIHQFRNSGNPGYAGYEAVFVDGRVTHCARVISSEAGYSANREVMRGVIES
ncbi:MAG: hypothetical protein E4G96_05670, partial [Chrysiogenales bacterium]